MKKRKKKFFFFINGGDLRASSSSRCNISIPGAKSSSSSSWEVQQNTRRAFIIRFLGGPKNQKKKKEKIHLAAWSLFKTVEKSKRDAMLRTFSAPKVKNRRFFAIFVSSDKKFFSDKWSFAELFGRRKKCFFWNFGKGWFVHWIFKFEMLSSGVLRKGVNYFCEENQYDNPDVIQLDFWFIYTHTYTYV